MHNQTLMNLDQRCAYFGYEMCRHVGDAFKKDGKIDKAKTENLITKSLGVLQENGIYAFFLYLAARGSSEADGAKQLGKHAAALLSEKKIALLPANAQDINAVLTELRRPDGLADNLDDLLLAKQLLEQALIYARYHAKAVGDGQ